MFYNIFYRNFDEGEGDEIELLREEVARLRAQVREDAEIMRKIARDLLGMINRGRTAKSCRNRAAVLAMRITPMHAPDYATKPHELAKALKVSKATISRTETELRSLMRFSPEIEALCEF